MTSGKHGLVRECKTSAATSLTPRRPAATALRTAAPTLIGAGLLFLISACGGGGAGPADPASVSLEGEGSGRTQIDAAAAAAYRSGFVYRQGRNLMLDGQVFRFVGVNAFGLTGCRTGTPDTQATMDAFFASLRPGSVTRTWAFRPQGQDGIERVVRTAERYGQKVIFALTDGAGYCADTDGRSGGEGSFKTDAWYMGGYRSAYFDWIRTVVPKYKDSPAIAMWEIANEPKGISAAVTDDVMKRFFDETAALIKSQDPSHLVSSGAQAEYVYGTSNYAYVHSGPNIDAASVHEYDYAYQNSRTIVSPHFNATLTGMQSIDKPLYVGETGIGLDGTCMDSGSRAAALKQKFDAYLAGGGAGVLYWGWVSNPDNGCSPYSGASDGTGSAVMTMIRSYLIAGAPQPPTPDPSPDPAPSARVIDDAALSFSGDWQTASGAGKYGGADRYTAQTGAAYTYTFTGAQIEIYTSVAPHHGVAWVSIDGGSRTRVDLYRATRAEQQLVYTSPVLSAGPHVLKVEASGERQSASTGVVVTADKLRVLSPPAVHDDAEFAYQGSWQTAAGAGKYKEGDHYSSQAGSTYSFQFNGTGLRMLTSVAPHHGILGVSVDNGSESMVDLFSDVRAEQQLVYTSPALKDGTHTLRVRVTGNKNPSASGAVGTADRIDVIAGAD